MSDYLQNKWAMNLPTSADAHFADQEIAAMTDAPEVKMFPIQSKTITRGKQAQVAEPIYMRAYEVYSHVYGPQKALIENGCRGGFGLGELTAFLWAYPFPKSEWRERVDKAFEGIKNFE